MVSLINMKGDKNPTIVVTFFLIIIQCSFLNAHIHEEDCESIVENDCLCEPGDPFRVSCPKVQPKIIVTEYPFDIGLFLRKITCQGNDDENLVKLLPNMKISNTNVLEFNNCSMLNLVSLKNITDKLDTQSIEKLYFSSKKINVLDGNFFADVPFKALVITFKVSELPEDIFDGSSSMRELTMVQNSLKTLPPKIFDKQTQLIKLDLSRNELRILPEGLFNKTKNLIALHLSFNKLRQIEEELFSHLHELKELYLDHNRLHHIHPNAFFNTRELTVLELSYNLLGLREFTFDGSSVFQSIAQFIGALTPTTYFKDVLFHEMSRRYELLFDDTGNHNYLQSLDSKAKPIYINLSRNNIARVTSYDLLLLKRALDRNNRSHEITEWIIDLNSNPLICHCSNSEFIDFVQRAPAYKPYLSNAKILTSQLNCTVPFSNFKNKLLSEIKEEDLGCELDSPKAFVKFCPSECYCKVRFMDRVVVFNCSNAQLTEVPSLPNITALTKSISNLAEVPIEEIFSIIEMLKYELHIENNEITALPALNGDGYERVSKIYARNNSIELITVTNLPANLSFLDLSYNKLEKLSLDVLEHLHESKMFNQLILHNNLLRCDCEIISEILRFPRSHPKINYENIICSDGKPLHIKSSECSMKHNWTYNLIVVVAMLFGLVIGILIAFYYKKQQEIHVWLFAHNMCLWLITEDELDKDKEYDAFISFSHKDEELVAQKLIPELEGGASPFKVCLHYRDWTVGDFIPDQIAKSVENSRRTVIILTPNFLESVWGRMEFRVAHNIALTEKRTRVIIIRHGEIGNIDDLDPELRAYLKTNTYLEWNDPRFFDKLRYALPHPGNYKSRALKISRATPESVMMNVIDDGTSI